MAPKPQIEEKDFYHPWYSYGVFRFTRDQIIWAIDNRAYFSNGQWPPEPSEYETDRYDHESKEWTKVLSKSSYVDMISQRAFNPNASFVNPGTIWGDIDKRLKLTKTDGKLPIKEIESMNSPNYDGLEYPESRCALDYISLFDFRKRPPYFRWRKRRLYYEKTGR